VPDIGVVVIASFDLSMAMGRPSRLDDPDLRRLVAVQAAAEPSGGKVLP